LQVDRIRSFASRKVRNTPKNPLEDLERLQHVADNKQHDISKRTQQVESAISTEAEWEAPWELLCLKRVRKINRGEMRQHLEKMDRLCPGGITTQREEDMPL
jgi:hypothetical protein